VGGSLNLGKIFGIQVRLHYSWFIIFLLVIVSLVYPNWSHWLSWVMGITTSLLLFASVLAHELAHSLVGRANDIPVRSITLFIFGGIAHMSREATKAGAELKMAAAGPACSLALGILFGLIWWLTRGVTPIVAEMVGWLAIINVALAAFNLIPGFPLDGGRVFRSLLWRFSGDYQRSTQIATRLGQGIAYAFILGGILIILSHLFGRPLFGLSWFDGIWIAFIGWFLQGTASMSYRQAQWREALRGITVSQMMTSDYIAVPPGITVSQLVQEYVMPRGHHLFLVTEGERLKGILTLQNIKSVPQSKWDTTRIDKVMVPAKQLKIASPDQDALSVVEQMDESEINQMPVASEGKIIGVVSRDRLLRFLRTRTELKIGGISRPRGRR
jgi:Zn-dependent protease